MMQDDRKPQAQMDRLSREALMKELGKSSFTRGMGTQHHNAIADFILSDRKRIVEPLVRFLPEKYEASTMWMKVCSKAINDTLELAGLVKPTEGR